MSSLKKVLRQISDELRKKEKTHETAQNSMRRATSLSKQAILLIHRRKMKRAEDLLEQAGRTISELYETSKVFPEIVHGGMLNAARQEYSEAKILLGVVKGLAYVTPAEIGVPSIDYVLGLADVVGECRRLALDALRKGDVSKGEEYFETMDRIYDELTTLDDTFMLVPGLRRKCDVARKIIETTRGDITQEVRRTELESYLRGFQRKTRRETE